MSEPGAAQLPARSCGSGAGNPPAAGAGACLVSRRAAVGAQLPGSWGAAAGALMQVWGGGSGGQRGAAGCHQGAWVAQPPQPQATASCSHGRRHPGPGCWGVRPFVPPRGWRGARSHCTLPPTCSGPRNWLPHPGSATHPHPETPHTGSWPPLPMDSPSLPGQRQPESHRAPWVPSSGLLDPSPQPSGVCCPVSLTGKLGSERVRGLVPRAQLEKQSRALNQGCGLLSRHPDPSHHRHPARPSGLRLWWPSYHSQ